MVWIKTPLIGVVWEIGAPPRASVGIQRKGKSDMTNVLVQLGQALGSGVALFVLLLMVGGGVWMVIREHDLWPVENVKDF